MEGWVIVLHSRHPGKAAEMVHGLVDMQRDGEVELEEVERLVGLEMLLEKEHDCGSLDRKRRQVGEMLPVNLQSIGLEGWVKQLVSAVEVELGKQHGRKKACCFREMGLEEIVECCHLRIARSKCVSWRSMACGARHFRLVCSANLLRCFVGFPAAGLLGSDFQPLRMLEKAFETRFCSLPWVSLDSGSLLSIDCLRRLLFLVGDLWVGSFHQEPRQS